MDKYLTQKVAPPDLDEKARKQLERIEAIKQMQNSPRNPSVEIPGSDFQEKIVKDLPVERIKTNLTTPLTNTSDFIAKRLMSQADSPQIAEKIYDAGANKAEFNQMQNGQRKIYGKNAPVDLNYAKSASNIELPEKTYDAGAMKREMIAKQRMDKIRGAGRKFSAGPVIGALTNIIPSLIDLKQGNSNTAATRMLTGLAPAGTGELDQQLMQQAQMEDKSPELLDPSYLRTLQAIGQRRAQAGKSPVVESFSGQEVDTSATQDSDLLNKIMAAQRAKSNG